jgi:hypothetical protein
MSREKELKCPGEAYTISPVVCRERQRRGWNKCRVCPHATLEEVVSIKPAQQAERKREPRRRNYYLVKKG